MCTWIIVVLAQEKRFVPLSIDLCVVHPPSCCLSVYLKLVCLLDFLSISMIVDASQSASAASAPAVAENVNGIPGVLAAVNDPIQFGGQQVEVQIPVHPGFQSGGGQQVAIPGFQSGAVQQNSMQLFGSQPGGGNTVQQGQTFSVPVVDTPLSPPWSAPR